MYRAQQGKQQGFILALALLMMLFVGLVVITSSERTGHEVRISQSDAPAATLQAAAEAGLYTVRERVKNIISAEGYVSAVGDSLREKACNYFIGLTDTQAKLADFLDLDGGGVSSNPWPFMSEDNGVPVFWWVDDASIEDECSGANSYIKVASKAYSGGFENPLSTLSVSAEINFDIEGGSSSYFDKDVFKALEDVLGTNSIYSGGPVSMNPASSVSGPVVQNSGGWNTPDPRDLHPADNTRTGFVKSIKDMLADGSDQVVESCSGEGLGSAKYVYCSGTFSSDIDSSLNGKVVVVEGSIGGDKGVNVKSSVVASFVSTGEINFKGFGNNTITGVVWSSGSVVFNGRSNIVGGVVSNGAVRFDGKTSIVAGGGVGDLIGGGDQDDESTVKTNMKFDFNYDESYD